MLPRHYENQNCSIARSLEVIGDRWTLLVLREAFLRTRRFEDFQRHLGIARNVLTDRLARLVDEGLLERREYQERPVRHEYRLTDKGRDLWPVLISLAKWGDRHLMDQPPVIYLHRDCGGGVTDRFRCDRCGEDLGPRDVEVRRRDGAAARAA